MSDYDNNWLPFWQASNQALGAANRARKKTIQGASKITRKKEYDIKGLAYMQFMRWSRSFIGGPDKQFIGHLRVRDALCGAGLNAVESEIVEGSPLGISKAAIEAAQVSTSFADAGRRRQLSFEFSDIRQEAVQTLEGVLDVGCAEDFCRIFRVNGWQNIANVERMLATDAVKQDTQWLLGDRRHRLSLWIDPNAPKDLPFVEIAELLTNPKCRKQADVAINISATAVKRILGVPIAQKEIAEWIGKFRTMFIDVLAHDEHAWIRLPIDGDPQQWTMIQYWAYPPRNDWRKAGFVDIKSDEGREAIKRYSETLSRRAA